MLSQYARMSAQEQEELLSNFLIDRFSVSGARCFARNQKEFEQKYIFNFWNDQSFMSAHVGRVYHKLTATIREQMQADGKFPSYDMLTMIGHRELDEIEDDDIRPQKNKTLEQVRDQGTKSLNALVENVIAEQHTIIGDVQESLFIEQKFNEWITLNGVEIPVPMVGRPDHVYVNTDGYLCIDDDKSKKSWTDEKDVHLSCAYQTVGYVRLIEAFFEHAGDEYIKKYPKIKEGVKRFRYLENKYTTNRSGEPQIKVVEIDVDEKLLLYEMMLFEPVWAMLQAVQNPDHVYLMNPDDMFGDSGQMLDFWVKTHLEGLDAFPELNDKQRALLAHRKSLVRASGIAGLPEHVIREFKESPIFVSYNYEDMQNLTPQQRIEHRLRCFNYKVQVQETIEGPSCITYLLAPGPGMKASSCHSYHMDIAIALGVEKVLISKDLVRHNGQAYIAIQVGREGDKEPVFLENKATEDFKFHLGLDSFSDEVVWDMGNPSEPHMLVAGSTGSGKSVAIQTLVEQARAKKMKVTILDPKREFTDKFGYGAVPEVETITGQKEIERFIEKKVGEMEQFFKRGVGDNPEKEIIIMDEAADAFINQTTEVRVMKEVGNYADGRPKMAERIDRDFKTLEDNVVILSQKARSAGIHLILAAQRFSVDVLRGTAKNNFPVRLCLTVAGSADSRVMLDQEGAEKLTGKGDALYKSPSCQEPVRLQCYMVNPE